MIYLLALPLVAAPLAYFSGRLLRPAAARVVALAALLLLWALFIPVAGGAVSQRFALGGETLRLDALGLLFTGLTLTLVTVAALFIGVETAEAIGEEKVYALLLILTGALIGVACAADLFNLWLWFELMVTSSYFLIAFRRDDPAALEATVKYLVQSALASALVLLGIALLLAQTGTLIPASGAASLTLDVAGVLLLIGFGVKLALVPLHTWLPDVYAQSPDAVSALLSAVITEAGLIALLRALVPLSSVGTLLIGFGLVNMVVGNLLALRQHELKRLLAFSSLPQIGFMLFAIGVGLTTGTPDGIRSGLFHLLNHGLMKGLAFLAAGALFLALHRQRSIDRPLRLDDLAGAVQRAPLAAVALTLALLSLAGIPPLAGFMSKWQMFAAGVSTSSTLLTVLTVFAAANSVFSLAYYLPVVNALFRSPSSLPATQPKPSLGSLGTQPLATRLPLVALSAALILVGLLPDVFTWLTQPASLALIQLFSHP